MDIIRFSFGLVDYIVFTVSICLCVGIGIYYAFSGGKQKTTDEYFFGNRKLRMLPVALSLVVTFESSILLLGRPAEVYIYGIMTIWDAVSVPLVFMFAARIVVPLFYPLKLTSAYEYLELRYKCRTTRIICTVIGFLYYIMYMAIVIYGPALALEAVIKIPLWVSIVVLSLVSMCYTALGGFKAVIWTDVLQCVVMNAGIIALIVKATMSAGGVMSVIEINDRYKRFNFFDFSGDPTVRHTFWNLLFGAGIRYMAMTFNQSTIQRVGSVESISQAKRLMYVAAPLFGLMGVMICMEGLITFAYFNVLQCDPMQSEIISNPNQLVPLMTVHLFSHMPGLAGLFIAALFSASLSTLSSGLSSLSIQLTEDIIKPNFKDIPNSRLTIIAKASVMIFGSIALIIAFLLAYVEGSLVQIYASFTTAFGGPLTGIFLYSIFCPWATKQGAISGGLCSMFFILWVSLGQNFSSTMRKQPWLPSNPSTHCYVNSSVSLVEEYSFNASSPTYTVLQTDNSLHNYDDIISDFWNWTPQGLDRLYSLSYQWFGAVSLLIVFFIGTVVSLILGYKKPKDEELKYLLPLGDTLFPYLPKRARRFLNCGLEFEKIQRTKMDEKTQSDQCEVFLKEQNGDTYI